MVFCIEKFASSLCLAHSTDHAGNDLDLHCFELTVNTEHFQDINVTLYNLYLKELYLIEHKIFNNVYYRSSDIHMKVILSSCVKISSTPSYFNFIVVSSLISGTVFDLFHEIALECFTFAKIASLCLIAVYNRCYKNFFEENEESESLDSFCKRMNPFFHSIVHKSQLPVDIQYKMSSLIASLRDVDNENFVLNDSELKMLQDTMYSNPPEEVKDDIEDLKETSNIPHCSLDEETDVVEAMNGLGENSKYSSRVNKICQFCCAKCFKWLLSFQRQIRQQSKFHCEDFEAKYEI